MAVSYTHLDVYKRQELCITGYTCGDLFLQEKLLREAKEELLHIAAFTTDVDAICLLYTSNRSILPIRR